MPGLNSIQYNFGYFCRLGSGAAAELLFAQGRATGTQHELRERLVRYRRQTPKMVRAAGGDPFPPRLTVVPR